VDSLKSYSCLSCCNKKDTTLLVSLYIIIINVYVRLSHIIKIIYLLTYLLVLTYAYLVTYLVT